MTAKHAYLTDGYSIGFNVDVVTLVHRLSVKACIAVLRLPVGKHGNEPQLLCQQINSEQEMFQKCHQQEPIPIKVLLV